MTPAIKSPVIFDAEAFLNYELDKIRLLPENAPSESGEHINLFWSLVVGFCGTSGSDIPTGIQVVTEYLKSSPHSDLLPVSVTASSKRLPEIAKRIQNYKPDPTFLPDYSQLPASALWPARKAFLIGSLVIGGAMVANEIGKNTSVNLYLVFLAPLCLAICIAGVIDPRIFWSLSLHGSHMPVKYRTPGYLALFIAVIFTVFLAFRYHIL